MPNPSNSTTPDLSRHSSQATADGDTDDKDGGEKRPNYTSAFPSADTVKANMERAGAAPEQITAVLWLLDHGRTNKLQNYKALGAVINREASGISKLFAGTYGADLDKLVRHINTVRAALAERAGFGDRVIVETSVMGEVRTLCEMARASQTMAILFGENQSGKTTALIEYTRQNNHGRTIYVRLPVGGAKREFLLALCRACGISERNNAEQMRERLLKFFGYRGSTTDPTTNSHLLLIVDEVHQTMIRGLKTNTLEQIREIHDLCGIGIVLCGTNVLPEMMQDERYAKMLGQIGNRGILRRKIPAAPSLEDVRLICEGYGFDAPEGRALKIVGKISTQNGIGKLCGYLRMARKLASTRHKTPGWKHFLATHATLESWERGDRDEKKQLGNGSGEPQQIEDGSEEA